MRTGPRAALVAGVVLAGSGALHAGAMGLAPHLRSAPLPLHTVRGSGVTGTALLTYNARATLTVVQLTVRGLTPGQVYPAHIHQGRCGGDGPILRAFTPLRGDVHGSAVSTATVPRSIWGQTWSIHVHRSPADFHVIACATVP